MQVRKYRGKISGPLLDRIDIQVEAPALILEELRDAAPGEASAVIRLRGPAFFWKIVLPSAAPYIFTGLRIGIGLSWLAIVAAEMRTGGVGIGFFLWDSYNSSLMSEIIVSLFYIGLVGLVLDKAITFIGRTIAGPGSF